MTIQEKIEKWISNWILTVKKDSKFTVQLLLGDGSTRSFFRVQISKDSFILLSDPEWKLSQDYSSHQKFLKEKGIPVPEFFSVDPIQGLLLMEDLGDDLLQHFIQKKPQEKIPTIEKAILLLADLHGKTFPVPKELPCAARSFDKKKYTEELLFLLEHLNDKMLGLKKVDAQTAISEFSEILEKIGPLCFSHRDYHTRNLLPKGQDLVMIDFQDARLGPPQYDVASILYDAYMPLETSEREKLLKSYIQRLQGYSIAKQMDWTHFEAHLESVALQRTLKAAGSFASFYTRYGKKTHLPYLIPALKLANGLRLKVRGLPSDFDTAFPIEKWIQRIQELKLQ